MKLFGPALALVVLLPVAAAAECAAASVGGLTISESWSRATTGTQRPAVFYARIRNTGSLDDRLTGIETPIASMPMLHHTVVRDGVASMSHADGIDIPAGQVVKLAPGGYHGMLAELAAPLSEGESFPVTLHFERAGAVPVEVSVLSIRAQQAQCDGAG